MTLAYSIQESEKRLEGVEETAFLGEDIER
jgi:hypothetical protein